MAEEKNVTRDNIQKSLMIKYSDSVAECFIKFVTDEAFDEDTLVDDIEDVTAGDLDNCSVIGHLAEHFANLFPQGEKQENLLTLLQNALKGEIPDEIHGNIEIDPNKVIWKVSKQEAKEATEFITAHCPRLLESRDKIDKALMDVLAIGIRNDFPLLNWLTDTYSRWRINNYYKNKSDITTADWRKKYKFLNQLQKTHKKTADKLESSIKSFFKRMFNQITIGQSVSVIDDNINEYIEYFIAMNEAVTTLANKNTVPFQIDMWIIPKNVLSSINEYNESKSDEDDIGSGNDENEEDTEFEEIGVDSIANLDYRLNENKFVFESVMNSNREKIKRNFSQKLESLMSGKRNQRIIVYIDRRNPSYVVSEKECASYVANNYGLNPDDSGATLASKKRQQRGAEKGKTWDDKIYFVQSNNEKYNELPSQHTPETSFWASTQCMLPQLPGEKIPQDKGYGCRNDFNGYQFMISWHCNSLDLIRCYWFSNCWGVRFFPFDAAMLWPKYFKQNQKSKKEQKIKADYVKKLKSMKQCNDVGFLNWFQNTTQTQLLLFNE